MANQSVTLKNQAGDALLPRTTYSNMKLSKDSTSTFNVMDYLADLPAEYVRLEYIQATGTQYIDTGLTLGSLKNVRIECGYKCLKSGTSFFTGQTICSARAADGPLWIPNAYTNFHWGTSSLASANFASYVDGMYYKLNMASANWAIKGSRVYNTGSATVAITGGTASVSTSTLKLFSYLGNSNWASIIQLFYFKLWEGGELKLALLPVKRISDSAIGVYDFVSGTFMTKPASQTASFSYGNYTSVDDIVATDSAKGVVELATSAEVTAGTDTTRVVTPATLKVELDKKAGTHSHPYLPIAGGTVTGPLTTGFTKYGYINAYYGSGNYTELIIRTHLTFVQTMNVLHFTGYHYMGSEPIDLRVVWYKYNGSLTSYSASTSTHFKPTIRLFSYTENSVEYVGIALINAASMIWLKLQGDLIQYYGPASTDFTVTIEYAAPAAGQTNVPANSVLVSYKAISSDIAGNAATASSCSGNAASAAKLQTERNLQVNLAGTTVASFNGTANASIGVTGTLGIANGGTGKTNAKDAAILFINALETGDSVPVDADYYVSQVFNGGSTGNNTYVRRPVSKLYNYIKGKTDTLYAASAHVHNIEDVDELEYQLSVKQHTLTEGTGIQISNNTISVAACTEIVNASQDGHVPDMELFKSQLNGKSDTGHTHSNYSFTTHTHSNYSVTTHTHAIADTTGTLALGKGGTGATDAATARTNLGAQQTLVAGYRVTIVSGNTINATYTYSLPTAAAGTLGGVKAAATATSNGVTFTNTSGTLAVTAALASTTAVGTVKVGTNINVTSGVISVDTATSTTKGVAAFDSTYMTVSSGTVTVNTTSTIASESSIGLNKLTTAGGVKDYVAGVLEDYATESHEHAIVDVNDLQTTLDAKLPKAGGTMTGNLTMSGGTVAGYVNGTAKNATTAASCTGNAATATTAAACSGNAATASSAAKLTTARTIALGTGATGTAASFNGTENITIPVTGVKEAYLEWGGKNFSGTYGPIDAAMIGQLGAVRTYMPTAAGIVIEYSRDSGETWTDYASGTQAKRKLFTEVGAPHTIGKNTTELSTLGSAIAAYQLRVTLLTGAAGIYTTLNKFAMLVSTSGSAGSYCTIRARTETNRINNTNTWVTLANQVPISGWSGWNIINFTPTTTYGNSPGVQYGEWQIIFGCTGGSSTTYYGLTVNSIQGFGGVGWYTPTQKARYGSHFYYANETHIYSERGIYPNANNSFTLGNASYKWSGVYAATFYGSLSGNARSASTAAACTGNAATATTAGTLTGLTSTVAELNYCDGVTSNIQTQLNGKAASSHTHSYAATSHTHAIADITSLQSTLDGKAASSHTHTIANVTNLQSTLDGKAASSHTHSAYLTFVYDD